MRIAGGFHCFGCGEKGDLISFHAKLNRLSFREAMADLARRYLLT
jgi:DNA primase